MATVYNTYPGGSKSRVSKAGQNIRAGKATVDDYHVVEEWRAAHRAVLNTFQAILRLRARGSDVVVAQRHKRRRTIFDKLRRFPKMELARMDDIAGCRLIFETMHELGSFRESLHSARFGHKRRNEIDKYDYIARPKRSGYRGIHDVYEYNVNSVNGRALAGLFVEIQYRTAVQHAWATAVEVVGFITESQPKFQEGDKRYEQAMALASEILARAHEGATGPYPDVAAPELVRQFLVLDEELGLMSLLRGLNAADKAVTTHRNALLIFSATGPLEIRSYRGATEALRALFALEKSSQAKDIVLVRADTTDEVRVAFRNYFSDAREFIRLLEQGCEKLAGRPVIVESTGAHAAPKRGPKRRAKQRR